MLLAAQFAFEHSYFSAIISQNLLTKSSVLAALKDICLAGNVLESVTHHTSYSQNFTC